MKSIIIRKPHELAIKEMPKVGIQKKDDVLIRVLSGGICGSDIGIFLGTNSLATYPRVIGHEYAGIVEEIGEEVTQVKVGDLVAIDPVRSCGECYACLNGRHNVCSSLEVVGVHRDGGFSEFAIEAEKHVYEVNFLKDKAYLAALIEPYSIGMEVNNRGRISEGDTVLITGSGPIGCCIMQVAKSRGAKVIMTDIVEERLIRAKEMGADSVINVSRVSESELIKLVQSVNDSQGYSVVVDCICSPNSFEQAIEFTLPAGRVVVLGTGNGSSSIPQVSITKKELDIIGSRLNNHCFKDVIKGMKEGLLTPEKLCTHVFYYEEVDKAFELITNSPSEVNKIVLSFKQ